MFPLAGVAPGRTDLAGSRQVGTTPVTLYDLAPGQVSYRLALADYEDATGSATVVAGRVASRTETLVAEEPTWSLDTILVQGGSFHMGSPSRGDSDARPVRTVTLDSFLMMATEVTFDAYDRFARAQGRNLPDDEGWGRGNRPAINVTWYDALAYANWLSEQDGLTPAYRIEGTNVTWNRGADGWRLPTEAEWEYAARGGTQSRGYTYAGSNNAGDVGWYSANANGRTQPVAGKRVNELGLYDMSGNVWEWCWDVYDSYPSRSERNPTGPSSGDSRVLRGGSQWDLLDYSEDLLRVAIRNWVSPTYTSVSSGFRLAAPAR